MGLIVSYLLKQKTKLFVWDSKEQGRGQGVNHCGVGEGVGQILAWYEEMPKNEYIPTRPQGLLGSCIDKG